MFLINIKCCSCTTSMYEVLLLSPWLSVGPLGWVSAHTFLSVTTGRVPLQLPLLAFAYREKAKYSPVDDSLALYVFGVSFSWGPSSVFLFDSSQQKWIRNQARDRDADVHHLLLRAKAGRRQDSSGLSEMF